jgi:hypothetical protein
MRFFIEIPDVVADKLRDQARAAHRPPRYHAGWLLIQALQEQGMPSLMEQQTEKCHEDKVSKTSRGLGVETQTLSQTRTPRRNPAEVSIRG